MGLSLFLAGMMESNLIDEIEKENLLGKKGDKEAVGLVVDLAEQPVSLQDSFRKFMEQKKKERQIQKMCQEASLSGTKRSQAFKDELRAKFIEASKKYLGVPYAERYKADDAPIAPLYLDCCGLIRQVVKDLQSEFGFVIGRWNQCYQMVSDSQAIKATDPSRWSQYIGYPSNEIGIQ